MKLHNIHPNNLKILTIKMSLNSAHSAYSNIPQSWNIK